MEYQKIFTEKYANQLLSEAKDITLIERYKQDKFDFDESKVLIIPGFEKPQGLLEKMNPNNNLESAIALYESYKNLTPLQASSRTFWIYLAHADLYEYMRKRWAIEEMKVGADPTSFILTHWFFKNGIMENHLAGLWWSVKCSIDENDTENPYKYTSFLFRDIRVRMRLGASTLFRHNEAVIGISKFFIENEELTKYAFQEKMLYIISHFNKLGATKQLTYLERNYFYNELTNLKSDIEQIVSDGRGRKKEKNDYESKENSHKEPIEQYTNHNHYFIYDNTDNTINKSDKTDNNSSVSKYINLFNDITYITKNNTKDPHKPLLLLSLFELIKENIICDNIFILSKDIINRFNDNWNKYINNDTFKCNIWNPLIHLDGSTFYRLNKRSSIFNFYRSSFSLRQFNIINKNIEIDTDLFNLCKEEDSFNTLKEYLLNKIIQLSTVFD